MYRETAGSEWRPILPGDRVMPRFPEDDVKRPTKEGLLWPSLRSQIFYLDATTSAVSGCRSATTSTRASIWRSDLRTRGRSSNWSAWLGQDRIPWRGSFVIEGGGKSAMAIKEIGASFLAMFPGNADLRRAFAVLRQAREQDNHISVKLRACFATWAPVDETAQAAPSRFDPVAAHRGLGQLQGHHGRRRSARGRHEQCARPCPGLDRQRRLSRCWAMRWPMLPWNRTASPWEQRQRAVPPAGRRHLALRSVRRIASARWWSTSSSRRRAPASRCSPTRSIWDCASARRCSARRARKLPLIGKADIGPSAEGFVRLIQEALGPERRHEAIFAHDAVRRRATSSTSSTCRSAASIRCRWSAPSCRTSWRSPRCRPNQSTPFEGMTQLIWLRHRRGLSSVHRGSPADRQALSAGRRAGGRSRRSRGTASSCTRSSLLARRGERALRCRRVSPGRACSAPRRADPRGPDRRGAHRPGPRHVRQAQARRRPARRPRRSFERYIADLIRRFPTLNAPTRLDFGPARIIVLDLR